MAKPIVAVVMGSDSDWPTMEKCVDQLRALGLDPYVEVMSAHRTPDRVGEFARSADAQGFQVIIAAAGMSAALAGSIAAHTILPVIGVPIAVGSLLGMDALLSTVQMPPGVPVAAVSIGAPGAANAAILAAQIIATHDHQVANALRQLKADQARSVQAKNGALQEHRSDKR